ncbi:MAG: pilus assembly protein [Anaerolineales bacterium]|nr:pilus assembly protein [Anaerolineales bacterium]
MLTDKNAGNMAEAAISMPVVLLILVLTLNVSRAGYAAMAARNAANYGARVGAVAGTNARAYAESAAKASLAQSGVGGSGEFPVEVLLLGSGRETVVSVTVGWSTPTIMAGICTLFGEGCPAAFSGEARAVWRREGFRP